MLLQLAATLHSLTLANTWATHLRHRLCLNTTFHRGPTGMLWQYLLDQCQSSGS